MEELMAVKSLKQLLIAEKQKKAKIKKLEGELKKDKQALASVLKQIPVMKKKEDAAVAKKKADAAKKAAAKKKSPAKKKVAKKK